MRTISAGESTILSARQGAYALRIEVKDAGGNWIAYDDVSGVDCQDRAEITQDANQRVAQATVHIAREIDGNLLSPLITADIDAGRAIRISGSRVAIGDAASYELLFEGTVDSWDCAADPMTLVSRDGMGVLVDRWVEEETEYGSEAGTAIETVMQSIIDDWADAAFTLYTPSSPGFLVTPYKQQKESVLSGLQTLADLIGWVLEYRWDDGTSAFRLTFYEPDRTPSATAFDFTADDYYDVSKLAVSRLEIRNAVTVRYTDAATGARSAYSAEDSGSITKYGRLWMEIEESDESPIDSDAEATTLGDAALSDLATPVAEQAVTTDLFWPVQLGDYYGFTANDVHYDVDQSFSVTGYTHVFENGTGKTTIQTRGAGAVSHTRGWIKREKKGRPPEEVVTGVQLRDWRFDYEEDGTLTIRWTRGDLVDEVWIYNNLRADPVPDSPWPAAGAVPDDVLAVGTDVFTTAVPASGSRRYVQFETRDANGFARWVRRFTISPQAVTTADDLGDASVAVGKLKLAVQSYSLSNPNAFSATDYDTVAWAAVTLHTAAQDYAISAGNTGNMLASTTYYIYFDPAVSTTTFQVSPVLDDASGEDVILLCIAQPKSNIAQDAFFLPGVGILGGLGEEQISANLIATNILAANTITAVLLNVGTLSAITADLGTVTAGSIANAGGTFLLDLDATGTDPLLTVTDGVDVALQILADGTLDNISTIGSVVVGEGGGGGGGSILTRGAFSGLGITEGGTLDVLDGSGNNVFAVRGTGSTIGFYGATPVAQQTGVAVTAAAIHAALVNLGLITA